MRRGIGWMDVVTAVTIVGLLLGLASVMRVERLAGSPLVIDGDTLVLAGRSLRLKGFDAPEIQQTCGPPGAVYRCGEEAKRALRMLIGGRQVSCVVGGRDRFERLLGTCAVEERDLGAEMVRRGLAVAYGAYEAEERAAREARIGLWAGPFERPADWRRRHPNGGSATPARIVDAAGMGAAAFSPCQRMPRLPMNPDPDAPCDGCEPHDGCLPCEGSGPCDGSGLCDGNGEDEAR